MSKQKNTDSQTSELLVNRYRETKAPPGFATRVMAHVAQDKNQHSSLLPGLLIKDKNQRWSLLPGLAITASVTLVAIVSIVVFNTHENTSSELQIATQKQSVQQVASAPESIPVQQKSTEQDSVSSAKKTPETVVAKATHSSATHEKAKITKEEHDLFFQATDESDTTSLAVLTDISDWLTDQKDVATPDISDLPDLDEIDNLFSTT